MTLTEEVDMLMNLYPKIYFACHTKHTIDPETKEKLTNNQLSILNHLDPEIPISLYELATHLGVTPSTMSITINRLEQGKFLMRKKSREDARKVEIVLTSKGVNIRKSSAVLDCEYVLSMLKRLSERERQLALEGLSLLASASEMEMKSKSLGKTWNNRNRQKK